MKNLIFAFVLQLVAVSILASIPLTSSAQDKCKECESRLIYVYDIAINSYNPYSSTPTKDCDDPCQKSRNRDIKKWKDLHFASPAYKDALNSLGNLEADCIAMDKVDNYINPWVTPDLFIDSKSSDWRVTTFTGVGEENLGPQYSTLPPHADLTDYLLYGILTQDDGVDQYTIKVVALNFRKNEILWESTCNTNGREAKISVPDAARAAVLGKKNLLKEVIPAYEKKKRDESNNSNNGLVALNGKLKFIKDSYFIEYNPARSQKQDVEFTLHDCDGIALKQKKISFTVTEGQLENSEVTTDENGHGKVVFIAPKKQCKASLTGSWAFEFPSGKKNVANAEAQITVNKPADKLNASVAVKIVKKTGSPSLHDPDPESSEQSETNFSTNMVLQIAQRRVARYLKDSKNRYECDKSTHCPVVMGSSYEKVYDMDKPGELKKYDRFPIHVDRNIIAKGKRLVNSKTQFVVVRKFESQGVNAVDAIDLEINTFYGPEDVATPAALTPQYIVTIRGGRYVDRMDPVKFPAIGNGLSLSWDDSKHKLVEDGNPLYINIPYFYGMEKQVQSSEEIQIPLLVQDAIDLDQWLLKPIGLKTLRLKGKLYQKDSYSESDQDVYVTVELSPKNE